MMYAEELRHKARNRSGRYEGIMHLSASVYAGETGTRYTITCMLTTGDKDFRKSASCADVLLKAFCKWLAAHATPKPEPIDLPF